MIGSNYLNYILTNSQKDDNVVKESTLKLKYVRTEVAYVSPLCICILKSLIMIVKLFSHKNK